MKTLFFLLVCAAESDLMSNADKSASSCGAPEPPVTAEVFVLTKAERRLKPGWSPLKWP